MAYRHKCKNQLSISKVLVLPDSKPDIEKVIRVASTPEVRKISSIKGKVVIIGDINVSVEYVASSRCNTQPVHYAAFKIPFAHFVEHRGANSCLDAKITAVVEFQEIQIVNRRSLTIFVILLVVIRRLESASVLIQPQVFIPTDCETNPNTCFTDCTEHITDSSECQSCSCVSCKIES